LKLALEFGEELPALLIIEHLAGSYGGAADDVLAAGELAAAAELDLFHDIDPCGAD
jgi:hypothetical protein